ncbi:MAG: N-acetyl-gamma-glutamyl-phosphate reductase [Firmicutes bacterium]|nr:N-acetyl-gamma-glutamyl-phosphate reductase [Bacillota bacterium]MCM1401122.1 N-acetyl-gamma-glutamyl-phosphate reductase [Bacteroides sp.]MCM1477055.1 N-acetyl-gamma-glutamyl-phosphate reductase [Bacteroides sp.]
MKQIKVGIVGGAGYTAGELIRILLNHPNVELLFVHSQSNAGNPLTFVHEGIMGETDMKFSETYDLQAIDCLFMCSGHGVSAKFWEKNERPENLKVVDLAQDFRDESNGYIYGLPELNLSRITTADSVANPGCYATAIQLALLPLAAAGQIKSEVHITGITGSTGAGVKPTYSTHFSWRTSNIAVYKAFEHQHLLEINRSLKKLMPGMDAELSFVPMKGDFARGIFITAYLDCDLTEEEARLLYEKFYADSPFTFLADKTLDLKQVVNTNKGLIWIEKHGKKLLILSAIDNLLKGASGQAVQNMNIMFGLEQSTGLKLKSSAF